MGPRPLPQAMGQYGRIMIYTLLDGHAEAFDRLAAEVTQAVRQAEPGTLVYACHTVDNSPSQRLFYQLFRDAYAVEEHTRQPHVQRFAQEARPHVSGTNVIELTVSAGIMAGPPPQQQQQQQHPVRWQHG
jgi:quinol monooxygenase YgiN